MNTLFATIGAIADVTGQIAASFGWAVYHAPTIRLMTQMTEIARKGASRTIDRKWKRLCAKNAPIHEAVS